LRRDCTLSGSSKLAGFKEHCSRILNLRKCSGSARQKLLLPGEWMERPLSVRSLWELDGLNVKVYKVKESTITAIPTLFASLLESSKKPRGA